MDPQHIFNSGKMYLFHGMKLITEEAIEFRNLVFLMLPFWVYLAKQKITKA